MNNATTQNTLFHLRRNTSAMQRATERLATGKRINSGKDDPAGLISAKQLEAAITALEAESRTIQRQHSNANIADGHASQLSSMLGDLKAKAVTAANSGALSDDEIAAHQMEVDSMVASIQRFAGDAAESIGSVGMPAGQGATLAQSISDAAAAIGSLASGGANSLTGGDLESAEQVIDDAVTAVTSARGTIGAFQKYDLDSRLESNHVARENMMESKSRIEDADFAEESSNLVRARIRTTASIKMLNIVQQNSARVLDLLN